jgi:glycine cleavage system H protein
MKIPTNLKYTKDHEWILIDGDIATIGITHFAQGELGDIVYVDVDTVDESIDRDAVFGTVEAVKTVSDLFMPLTGEVIELNDILANEPSKINADPYGDGWIIKVKIADLSQVEDLLDAQTYSELIGG